MVEQAAAAGAAKAALGPFGRAVAHDMLRAADLHVAAALDAEEGNPAPGPAHGAMAGLDMAPHRHGADRDCAAQALAFDAVRLFRHSDISLWYPASLAPNSRCAIPGTVA